MSYDDDLPLIYGKDDNPIENWKENPNEDDDRWEEIETINYGNEVKKND